MVAGKFWGGLALAAWLVAGFSPAGADARPPSIVFILSDDEDVASHAYMPKTKALIEDQGALFANYFVSYSFCCPSRTTILRGQYSHNHRVQGNEWPTGGFDKFASMGHAGSTIATWLDAAGYRTGFFGKLMNGYEAERHGPLPGWDAWYGVGGRFSNYNYKLNENGKVVAYGARTEDHLTDVLARKAVGMIEAAPAEAPLFLYIAPYDPHSPSEPALRHIGKFADVPLPEAPAYDEADVSDKPAWIRALPRLAAWQKEAHERHHKERLRALQSVDDLVEGVIGALERTGRLDDTYVVYTSDNGWHMGQHRLFVGKTTAYEEDIRVPFAIRGPGIRAGTRVEAMVLNNDLAPTFAAVAGAAAPAFVDGRSFLPLLAKPAAPWRKSFLIERRETETHEISGPAIIDAIRTDRHTYIEYGTGERELYNHATDPYQLDNAVREADPALLEALSGRLAELKNCASSNCRTLENLPVEPDATPVAASDEGSAG